MASGYSYQQARPRTIRHRTKPMKSTDPSSHSLNYTVERLGHDTRPTDDNGGNRHTQAIFVFEGTKDLHTKSKAVSSLSGHHNAPDDSTLLDSESTDDELSDRESHSESSSSARGNQNQNDDDDEWLPASPSPPPPPPPPPIQPSTAASTPATPTSGFTPVNPPTPPVGYHYPRYKQPKDFACNQCNAAFAVAWALKRHKRKEHAGLEEPPEGMPPQRPPPKPPFRCEKCDQLFRSHYDMTRHITAWHLKGPTDTNVNDQSKAYRPRKSKPKPVVGPLLRYVTDVSENPVEDLSKTTKNFVCVHCSQRFISDWDLQNHVVIEHDDEFEVQDRPFRCSVMGCPRFKVGYVSQAWLDQHMRKVHPENEDDENDTATSQVETRSSSNRDVVINIDPEPELDSDTDDDEVDLLVIPDEPRQQNQESSETPIYTGLEIQTDEGEGEGEDDDDVDEDNDRARKRVRLETEAQAARDALIEILLEENIVLRAELLSMKGLEEDYKILRDELGELRGQIEIST